MRTIYKPKGKAKEYGEYALNIYTGCPHRCFYCFAPRILKKDKEEFHTDIRARENIIKETEKYIKSTDLTDETVHLCFTCDPYPTGYDSSVTREIIKLLKESGNHVQILTKGSGTRDFDLLDAKDWYGVTLDGSEKADDSKTEDLKTAHAKGISTWVSFEPVIDAERVLKQIKEVSGYVDKVKIGKLNYYKSDIDWKVFGKDAETLCQSLELNYYIKESLRKEM